MCYENTLAGRINYALERRGMKQADLARTSGLSTAQIAQIATGKTKDPRFMSVVKIAKALDVTIDFLAGVEK